MTDDLVAADVIAAANHDDNFSSIFNGWFNLFSDPVGASGVETAGELALKLFAGEFEENTFSHDTSVS